MHGFLLTFTLLIMLFVPVAGEAFEDKIYKWTDKDGKIHFSDKPPQDQSIKVEEQKIDSSKLTVTSMPRSQRLTPLSEEQCQSAMINFRHTEPLYRGDLVEKLAKKQITDEQFSQGLAKLDELKSLANINSCTKAQSDERTLLSCMAQNKDARSCIK